jgi:hypothetical protein
VIGKRGGGVGDHDQESRSDSTMVCEVKVQLRFDFENSLAGLSDISEGRQTVASFIFWKEVIRHGAWQSISPRSSTPTRPHPWIHIPPPAGR